MNTNEAHSIIQEAMKDVKQEIVILLNGEHHLIYIHKVKIDKKGKVTFDFSTPSNYPKDELVPHIENCIKAQYQDFTDFVSQEKGKKWKLLKSFFRT